MYGVAAMRDLAMQISGVLAILVADCLPVLFASADGTRVAAARYEVDLPVLTAFGAPGRPGFTPTRPGHFAMDLRALVWMVAGMLPGTALASLLLPMCRAARFTGARRRLPRRAVRQNSFRPASR